MTKAPTPAAIARPIGRLPDDMNALVFEGSTFFRVMLPQESSECNPILLLMSLTRSWMACLFVSLMQKEREILDTDLRHQEENLVWRPDGKAKSRILQSRSF